MRNTHTGELPSWRLNINQEQGITTVPDFVDVAPNNIIEARTITPSLNVTFDTDDTVSAQYTLNIRIGGAPVATWFTGPDVDGGGKDVSKYITASFDGQVGSVTLDAKTLSVGPFINTVSGSGSIVKSPTFPAGFSFDAITLPDPDAELTGAATITPSTTTLVIRETESTTNTVPYTLATIALTELAAFLPPAHITVTETGSSSGLTGLSYSIRPKTSGEVNDTIVIRNDGDPNTTGFINTPEDTNTYTLTVAAVTGKFTLPDPITLTITEPAGVSPGLGMLTAVAPTVVTTIAVINAGDMEATTYNVEVMFTGAAITSWFTAADINNYFSGATFAGQTANLSLGANNVITLAGNITNVPNGDIVLTTNTLNGFTLTVSTLTDPDGPAVDAITAGDTGGMLTITETGRPLANTQTYPVQISLTAYRSQVTSADVTVEVDPAAMTGGVGTPTVTLDGATITISGFINIAGDSDLLATVTIADLLSVPVYTVTTAPDPLTITNPAGTADTNVDIGTASVTYRGLTVIHTIVVNFRPSLSVLALNVTGADVMNSPVENILSDGTDAERTITVTAAACEIADLNLQVVNTTYSVANPPVYYDRNLLSATVRDANPMPIPTDLRIVDDAGEVVATFPLIVEFPPCELADVTTGAGTATDPYLLSQPQHLELMAHLVNNSNATHGASHYTLTATIDLGLANAPWAEAVGGLGFTPIGHNVNATTSAVLPGDSFAGTFDCDDNVISNLYINKSGPEGTTGFGFVIGLFGYISGATIMDCRLENVNVKGTQLVGGLVATMGFDSISGGGIATSTISGSYVTGQVSGNSNVGGMVGSNIGGAINDSYTTTAVTGTGANSIGGLVGSVSRSFINRSYATGRVSGGAGVGGLVGYLNNSAIAGINDSYATGEVDGNNQVGGLIGNVANFSTITNAYAIGKVTGDGSRGGLIGSENTMTPVSSYWDTTASMLATSSGGSGRTTEQMQVATAVAITRDAGMAITNPDDHIYSDWDTTSVWLLSATGYPTLRTVVCPDRQTDPNAACP